GYRAAAEAALAAERPAGPQPSLLAFVSATVGAFDLLLLIPCVMLLFEGGGGEDGVVAMLGLGVLGLCIPLAVTVCGVVSLLQIRSSGGRLFGLPAAVFATVLFPLLLLNVVVGFVLMMTGEYGLLLVAARAVLGGNAWLVYRAWKLLSAGTGPLAVSAAEH